MSQSQDSKDRKQNQSDIAKQQQQDNESPKGGSTLFRKGTAGVAAESELGEKKKRDKDGKPV